MRTVLIILMLSTNSLIFATNYYVKNGGNDAASGTSDATAWAHHPWMSTWSGSIVLKPGDNVFMKRGDIWTIANPNGPFISIKQSGSESGYITTTAYGDGDKPVMEISTETPGDIIYGLGKSFIIFSNLEIRHYSPLKASGYYTGIQLGRSGNDVSHNWIINNCDIHNIPGTGIHVALDAYNIIIGDTTITSTATSKSYSNHIYDCGYAGVAMGGCDPVTGNSNFYVYHNYIHDININGADQDLAYGVGFSSNTKANGVPRYCYVRYNFIENIPSWTGLDCHNGQYIYFQDNNLYNCKLMFGCQAMDFGAQWTPKLDNLYIERNTLENPGDFKFASCYFAHINGVSTLNRATNIYIRDNTYLFAERPTGQATSFGIKLTEVDGVLIEGNQIYNGPPGSSNGAINVRNNVRNVTIRKNYIAHWSPGILLQQAAMSGDININSNIIYSEGGCIVSQGTSGFLGKINIFNNSILVKPVSSTSQPISFYGTIVPVGSSLKIINNIVGFITLTGSGRYILAPNTITGSLEIDHNLYWNSTRSDPFYLDGIHDWNSWNNLGHDNHGIYNANPLFRNLSGSYVEDLDFQLQSNSPAIDKGINVGLIYDYLDLPVTEAPDIGAFENHQSGSSRTNSPPVPVIKNMTDFFSGFVGEIDASDSYDPDNDVLTFEWTAPDNIPVSSIRNSKIQFLAPSVNTAQTIEFQLKIDDGRTAITRSIHVNIMPYKPELSPAEISNIKASTYLSPDYPKNVIDGNISTKWSADGENQYLVFSLAGSFSISHLEIGFLQEQKFMSYFDIFASRDNVIWEPILTKAASCNFSGENQVFDFPEVKASINYSYIKLVGRSNSLNTWNYFSEFKIYGTNSQDGTYSNPGITIYPNPAVDYFNISVNDSSVDPEIITISTLSGTILYTYFSDQGITNIPIPEYLLTGIYIVKLMTNGVILFAQKLVINR